MHDQDARTAALKAHRRITKLTAELRETTQELERLEALIPTRPNHTDGLCELCGAPCTNTYCHAHTWAAGAT